MNIRHITIRRGIGIFSVFTILAICLLVGLTANRKTIEALKLIDPRFLALSLVLVCLSWCFDALRLMILTGSTHAKLPFLYSIKAVLASAFLANITPSSAGGESLLVYLLNRNGVPLGKAAAISFLRMMITLAFFAIGGPVIIYFHGYVLSNTGLKMLFDYVAVLLAVTVALFAYLAFAPFSARKNLEFLFRFCEKFPFLKGKMARIQQRFFHVVDEFKSSLKIFIQGERWRLVFVVFFTALMIFSQFLAAPMLLAGLGCRVEVMDTFIVQGVLNFMLYYMPTPGGSGISEGIGYALFAPLAPSHILGIFLVLWKFLTSYVWTIAGGLIIARTIGMKYLEDITKDKENVEGQ